MRNFSLERAPKISKQPLESMKLAAKDNARWAFAKKLPPKLSYHQIKMR
jgi:hypothetical protein